MDHWVFILCTSFHSLGWVLLGYWPFFLQFSPYFSLLLVCGSTSVPAMPFRCFCDVTTWFVFVGPLLGLPCIFFYSIHIAQCFYWVNPHTILGFLDPFHSFGYPRPALFPWASLAYSILTFPWAFAIFFGFPRPNYHILYFRGSLAFIPTPFANYFLLGSSAPFLHTSYFL